MKQAENQGSIALSVSRITTSAMHAASPRLRLLTVVVTRPLLTTMRGHDYVVTWLLVSGSNKQP